MIKSHQKFFNLAQVVLEVLLVIVSLLFAWFIRFNTELVSRGSWYLDLQVYFKLLYILIPAYIFINHIWGLYRPHRMKSFYSEAYRIIQSNALCIGMIIGYLYLTKQMHYSRYLLFFFMCTNIFLTIIERGFLRFILKRVRSRGYNLKHILIIGAGELGCRFANKIVAHKYMGLNIIGFIDDYMKQGARVSRKTNAKVLGTIRDLADLLETYNPDQVIMALDLSEYDKIGQIINICERQGTRVKIVPDYYKFIPAKPFIDELDDMPIIDLRYIPLEEPHNKFLKRGFDILFSLIVIVATSPILLMTALIIRLTSPGKIIFRQERVGFKNQLFQMYKFRSMHECQDDEIAATTWTVKDDCRRTAFGTFIRKTSIDELPQFFNVLKGDMSVVGPRPERPYFVEQFREKVPKYMVKHQVRPGITGWAQVNGWRGDTSIKTRIEHDIYYIENWSFNFDIRIIIKTLLAPFQKSAY